MTFFVLLFAFWNEGKTHFQTSLSSFAIIWLHIRCASGQNPKISQWLTDFWRKNKSFKEALLKFLEKNCVEYRTFQNLSFNLFIMFIIRLRFAAHFFFIVETAIHWRNLSLLIFFKKNTFLWLKLKKIYILFCLQHKGNSVFRTEQTNHINNLL